MAAPVPVAGVVEEPGAALGSHGGGDSAGMVVVRPAGGEAARPGLGAPLGEWAVRAAEQHAAEQAKAAAYAARHGTGPRAATIEFERLGVIDAMRSIERAARQVYGEPPAEWGRYYPSPVSAVNSRQMTEVILAAGQVTHTPAESGDPVASALSGRERLVPRITLRVGYEFRTGMLRVGHVEHPAPDWTRESFEDTLLDQLHQVIDREIQ